MERKCALESTKTELYKSFNTVAQTDKGKQWASLTVSILASDENSSHPNPIQLNLFIGSNIEYIIQPALIVSIFPHLPNTFISFHSVQQSFHGEQIPWWKRWVAALST